LKPWVKSDAGFEKYESLSLLQKLSDKYKVILSGLQGTDMLLQQYKYKGEQLDYDNEEGICPISGVY
jgi:hypothetical protein